MNSMNSVSPINLKKARRYLRRSYMDDGDDDASIVSEDLPILKENEIGLPYKDRKFVYVFGKQNLINLLKSKGSVSVSKPSSPKSNVHEIITLNIGDHTATFEKMKERFVYVRNEEGEKTILITHPFKKSVKFVNNKNSEKFTDSFRNVFGRYEKPLCIHCLLRRVDDLLQGEWNKIHENKKPGEVYRDRTDKSFPTKYTRISYGKADAEAMRKEWDGLHANKRPVYVV